MKIARFTKDNSSTIVSGAVDPFSRSDGGDTYELRVEDAEGSYVVSLTRAEVTKLAEWHLS